MTDQPITHTERIVLDLYMAGFRREGDRIALIRQHTGLSEVGAIMFVSELIDSERALKYSPDVVRRLRTRRNHRNHRTRSRRHRTIAS